MGTEEISLVFRVNQKKNTVVRKSLDSTDLTGIGTDYATTVQPVDVAEHRMARE